MVTPEKILKTVWFFFCLIRFANFETKAPFSGAVPARNLDNIPSSSDEFSLLKTILINFSEVHRFMPNNYPFVLSDFNTQSNTVIPKSCFFSHQKDVCKKEKEWQKHQLSNIGHGGHEEFVNWCRENPLLQENSHLLSSPQKKAFQQLLNQPLYHYRYCNGIQFHEQFDAFIKLHENGKYFGSRGIQLQIWEMTEALIRGSRFKALGCGEIAGMTYMQLLNFQRINNIVFDIHQINVKYTNYAHVFLAINAKLGEAYFENSSSIENLYGDNAYIVDPYFGQPYAMIPVHHSDVLNLHKGMGASVIKVSPLPSYQKIKEYQQSEQHVPLEISTFLKQVLDFIERNAEKTWIHPDNDRMPASNLILDPIEEWCDKDDISKPFNFNY